MTGAEALRILPRDTTSMWTVLLVMDDGVETPHHISGTGAFLHGVICASDTVLKLEEWPRA